MLYLEFLKDLCISELCEVNNYPLRKEGYPINNKGRLHHGFIYTTIGSETYSFKDKTIITKPQTVLYIPKNEAYTITLNTDLSVVQVFDFETNNEHCSPFIINFKEASKISAIFDECEKIWNKGKAYSTAESKALFYKSVAAMIRYQTKYLDSEKSKKIDIAIQYIHDNYLNSDFKVNRLSEISGVSQRYFEKLFLQKYSITPKEYIINLKIQKAKEMLSSHLLAVKDIAEQLGFCDVYHFSKTFKLKTGYTPREYKNNYK